ncbi:MAG: hypothetical protein FGM15_10570 [Chthoniobacterales bacterium]|nr:hypothetical protein [Chthoniobacterales bacterium]
MSKAATIFLGVLLVLTGRATFAQTSYTWTGGGSDNNWGTGANWSGGIAPSGDTGNNVLVFAGSTRTNANNNLGNWSLGMGQLQFASGAASFTLSGDNFGFRPYLGSQEQQIIQNSANTQTIGVGAFSFRNDNNSRINLNAGDLVITASDLFIDASSSTVRNLTVTGTDTTRRTVTFAGNVNKGASGQDPDMYIQENKRALVTGSLTFGSGNDASVFVENGVLQFSGSGSMTGGRPLLGATSGSADASLFLDTAGSTFGRQVEFRSGSSGRRTVGGLNTNGTVTFSGDFVGSGDIDLAAATGGTVVVSGTRNFNSNLLVNRPDGATTYGGTVVLSNSTTSSGWTALEGGTLEFGNLNQIGTAHFEFNASSGDSGTMRYTGGTATNTRTLWIDNTGITRAAIDIAQAGTTFTWNPADGNVNQNLTKTGAGTLVFGANRITGNATVGVEAGTLVITGTNTYAGGTTVANGTLVVSAGGAAGGSASALGSGSITVGSGGQLTWHLSASGSHTISNAISLSGGTLYTEDGANTFSGLVTLASGASTISAQYEDTITLSGGLSGSGNVIFTQSGSTGGWAAPTYVLSAAGSNTGTVRINGSSGSVPTQLQLGHVNALQNATLDLATGDTGVVAFTVAGTNTYNLGGLQGSRNLDLGANSISVGGNGNSTAYSGVLSGAGSLIKSAAGTLTLTGTNTYNGATTVSGGQLTVNGAANNTTVTVQSGARLGGGGSIGGLILGSGSTLAPGNSVGLLTATNAILDGGAAFELEVFDWLGAGGTGWDLLAVNGNLTLSNTTNNKFTINLVSLQNTNTPGLSTNWNAANSFTNRFISYTGSLLGTTFSPDLFTVNTGGFQNTFGGTFSVTNVTGGLALLYTPSAPVPEPGTWAAAALLAGGVAFARWRKRRIA